MADTWTARLWASISGVYAAILAHPFLDGLTSGSLPERAFAYYLAQDAHYLRDYARALAVVGAKAPDHQATAMFARHAAAAIEVEMTLHSSLLASLGMSAAALEAVPVAPTTRAYTSYLLAVGHGGSFAEGLAAVLPCYWVYQSVGRDLIGAGSPDPRYQRWIETYADEEFAAAVAEVLALADRTGEDISELHAAAAGRHFETTARYEWMFWDAAWRQEKWPL